MRAFGQKTSFIWFVSAALFCMSSAPGRLLADDKDDSNPPAKAAPVKIDAPSPGLTERERWLLDRVEQLEKRVADLESRGNPSAVAEASASQPASLNPATSSALGNAASPAIGETTGEVASNVIPETEAIASIGSQEKPVAPKAPKT